MKIEKQIEQLFKSAKTKDLNWLKCNMDYFFKREVKKRNENKVGKFKVGEVVVFNPPVNADTQHLPLCLKGTITKLGKTKINIDTKYGVMAVPATRVGHAEFVGINK